MIHWYFYGVVWIVYCVLCIAQFLITKLYSFFATLHSIWLKLFICSFFVSFQLFHWSMVSNEVEWWHVPKQLLFACSRQFATAPLKLRPLCPAEYRIDRNQSANKSNWICIYWKNNTFDKVQTLFIAVDQK